MPYNKGKIEAQRRYRQKHPEAKQHTKEYDSKRKAIKSKKAAERYKLMLAQIKEWDNSSK